MVDTMEKLCEMKYQQPKKLAHVRDIGKQSLAVIDEVIGFYEDKEIEPQQYLSPPERDVYVAFGEFRFFVIKLY